MYLMHGVYVENKCEVNKVKKRFVVPDCVLFAMTMTLNMMSRHLDETYCFSCKSGS